MTDKHERKKQDIINTAFVQWSKGLFANTSLTVIAEAMGMSKPALFRYFPSKESLFEAMIGTFTSDLTLFAEDFIRSAEHETLRNSLAILLDKGFDFFAKHHDRHYFMFFMGPMIKKQVICGESFRLYQEQTVHLICEQYSRYKGIAVSEESCERMLVFVFYTAVSVYMHHCKHIHKTDLANVTEDMLVQTKQFILNVLFSGLRQDGYGDAVLTDEDFARIENDVIGSEMSVQRDKVFAAITSVIARDGIANASMDKIAKAMGFSSKSSLYAHWTSRDNMLQELFRNETDMILNYIKANGLKYDNFNEDLYGCMVATFCYFTANINVLEYFDWLHYQMIQESVCPHPEAMPGMFVMMTKAIRCKYNVMYDTPDMSDIMSVVLLGTYIVRLVVRKNGENGGTTSPNEVRDLREIYKICMEGI